MWHACHQMLLSLTLPLGFCWSLGLPYLLTMLACGSLSHSWPLFLSFFTIFASKQIIHITPRFLGSLIPGFNDLLYRHHVATHSGGHTFGVVTGSLPPLKPWFNENGPEWPPPPVFPGRLLWFYFSKNSPTHLSLSLFNYSSFSWGPPTPACWPGFHCDLSCNLMFFAPLSFIVLNWQKNPKSDEIQLSPYVTPGSV